MSALAILKAARTRFTRCELRKSLLAALTLGLALGASLASSIAASEGSSATAVALAALSLLLTLGIALTVVPRLFQRVRREWHAFSLSITREGWCYLLVLLVIAFAAFNTGNNLIFMILSASLALLVVSEGLSSLNLKRLDLQIDLPESVPAQQTFVSALHLRNLKGWFPVFSLSMGVSLRSAALEGGGAFDSASIRSRDLADSLFALCGNRRACPAGDPPSAASPWPSWLRGHRDWHALPFWFCQQTETSTPNQGDHRFAGGGAPQRVF